MMGKQRSSRYYWPGVLFALPFVMLGLAALIAALYPVVQHLRSLAWQPVPATVLSVSERNSAVQKIGESTTYRIEGAFRYRWQQQERISHRLTFSLVRDDLDDGWREAVMGEIGPVGNTITAWINPNAPDEAVVIRAIRWNEVGFAMLGALMFGAGGVVLMVAAFTPVRPGKAPSPQVVLWPLVLCLLATGPIWLVLVVLLIRDGHPIWAGVCLVPVALALNGVRVGLQQRTGTTASARPRSN
ncbi:DUF3592 domain-containing protein [Chitinivorax sp. B]|uniref:DUF3592 domain-containing protein n=1 Tax=Chitinivorax sp. B TaxID=2502235 RepID=UPI0010F4E73E|nr:DUF3592 domain-containing protein [Chitinivorax sp. B]